MKLTFADGGTLEIDGMRRGKMIYAGMQRETVRIFFPRSSLSLDELYERFAHCATMAVTDEEHTEILSDYSLRVSMTIESDGDERVMVRMAQMTPIEKQLQTLIEEAKA